jgi:hypothetical protein
MRAKHKSGFVYTTRGYDPDYEAVLAAPALVVDPSAPQVSSLADRRVCPHDGDYVDGYPRCGFCLGSPGNATTAEESFALFLISLHTIAKKVAWSTAWSNRQESNRLSYEDRVSECFMLLLNPKNLNAISEASSPMAMATTIAQRRLKNVYRDPYYRQTLVTSQVRDRGPEDEAQTDTDKMDAFDCRERQAKGDYSFQPDTIRLFPGFKLL